MDQLVRRLRQEFTANPKKGAVLGIMALVALYFWVPLVWGWVKPAKAPVAASVDPNAGFLPQLAAAASSASTTDKTSEIPMPPWYQLVEWMDQDPYKQSTLLSDQRQRDPFHLETELAERPAEKTPAVRPPATPEALGLNLSGTIVGSDRRVAVINGKTYREGTVIEWKKQGESLQVKLVEIRPREALVQLDGREWTLKVPPRKHEGKIEPFSLTE